MGSSSCGQSSRRKRIGGGAGIGCGLDGKREPEVVRGERLYSAAAPYCDIEMLVWLRMLGYGIAILTKTSHP
jgi:hypothetical protein